MHFINRHGCYLKTIITIASRSVSAIYSTGDIKGNGVICIVQEKGAQKDPAGALCTGDNSTESGGKGEIHPRRVR